MSLKGLFPIDKWEFQSQLILHDLNEEDYNMLMKNARKETYKKSAIVFREGAYPSGVYIIQSGMVKKYKIDNTGREHIFYIARAGEMIGYHPVISSEHYVDTTMALEDCVILFIPTNDFLNTLHHSAELSRRLLKILSHEFGVLVNHISVSAQRPVRERVALALILLRQKFATTATKNAPVTIQIARADIAHMSGTTRENITRFITEFKKNKIIETIGRKIIIIDVQKLTKIANFQ